MNIRLIILLFLSLTISVLSQERLKGTVVEKNEDGIIIPINGASIYWLNSSAGTTSNEKGEFILPYIADSTKLVASMLGYLGDTITVYSNEEIQIVLTATAPELNNVVVTGSTPSLLPDYLNVQNNSVITEKELCKAACCNLSESFETNASVDISFADAITGAKQIEMLGLSGIYTQTTVENLPFTRGLLSSTGLSFIPGTWVQSISMSKGVGSVINGFESITGQIDIDMKKPVEEDSEKMLLNVYGDNEFRMEGNFNFRFNLGENLSAITLMHASKRNNLKDENNDEFVDMPAFTSYNLMQRWNYLSQNGWAAQFGFHYIYDEKNGGTINRPVNNYNYFVDNRQFNIYGKIGYSFPDEDYRSYALQWSLNNYNIKSLFGDRNYTGNEFTGYWNFIYQSILVSENHKYSTGISFLFDQYKETFVSDSFARIERIPGAFLEYSYIPSEAFSINLGVRSDYHNSYGIMVSPRLHARYSPHENWVFRLAAGKGFRTSNIFSEYASVMASSRKIVISNSSNFGYGLQQEKAWNYGFNVIHYFLFDYRDATISLDIYRTEFQNSTIADLDSNPNEIRFASIKDGAYSNSIQLELNLQPFERFDMRIAYRNMDVKQEIGGKILERPLIAQNRVLLNLAYATERHSSEGSQMLYDLTLQWYGKKRLPGAQNYPADFQLTEYSPAFALVNTHVTRIFGSRLEIYLGIENLFDFTQEKPIIDPLNPYGEYFDASIIWGPTTGRLAYAGVRLRI